MKKRLLKNFGRWQVLLFLTAVCFLFEAKADSLTREFALKENAVVEVVNPNGKVIVETLTGEKAFLIAESPQKIAEAEVVTGVLGNSLKIKIGGEKKRIDIKLQVPLRSKVKVQTVDGEVGISGNLESAEVKTSTGTIYTDVSTEDLKYNFLWTLSRPRFLSNLEVGKVREKAAGHFVLEGKVNEIDEKKKPIEETNPPKQQTILLNFTTERGIILLNTTPQEVPSDLRDRALTTAAKAIVRSGDSQLVEAIRKASPKYFGDYAKTLPPRRDEPSLSIRQKEEKQISNFPIKRLTLKVLDKNNRTLGNLSTQDFSVFEKGKPVEILEVSPSTAPFNLVLLLDISGSIENYVDFIRKTARDFVNTMRPEDRISIVIFNEDVKTLSRFTTDRKTLSESLDDFDSGGGTAYYDALAYSLVETLRPLRGERTAIVVLTDGDDNRSFLPFGSVLNTIEESGALIYPLYVPSGLIAASKTTDPNLSSDSLRTRYLSLSSRAEGEGQKLAEKSGGVYFSIKKIEELQKAYNEIVVQLRSAYNITFRSETAEIGAGSSPKIKAKVNRDGVYTNVTGVYEVSSEEAEKWLPKKEEKEETPDDGEIRGEILQVNYTQLINDKLREFKLENFNFNSSPSAFVLTDGDKKMAVSRWVSPKRTRSYPYERVYETLAFPKRVAVIPVVKDEGTGGERDFLQWDTISLLSLLDVHVVLAYYNDAKKHPKQPDQITEQKFDNAFLSDKLKEINNFSGSPREWNEKEARNLKAVLEKAKLAYQQIKEKTKVVLHDETTLDELINFAETPEKFVEFSRQKSQKAQTREFQTEQPKEALSSDTKARVTITNSLFGKYFFTVDETKIEDKTVSLIEAKHSQRNLLPSESDIKDGLIKMMLYVNLQNVKVGKTKHDLKVAIRLTSSKLSGSITSEADDKELENFCKLNKISLAQQNFLLKLFQEARENRFTIVLENGETKTKK